MNDFVRRNKKEIQTLVRSWVEEVRKDAVVMEKGEKRDIELELAKRLEELADTLNPKQGKQEPESFI